MNKHNIKYTFKILNYICFWDKMQIKQNLTNKD